jgi:hypothetical protein
VKAATVRAILAILIVGVFVIIFGFLAIYPVVSETNFRPDEYADYLVKTSSVYAGLIGVIIGYYFGRSDKLESSESNNPRTANRNTEDTPIERASRE